MHQFMSCGSCGRTVVPFARSGRTRKMHDLKWYPVPEDVRIPTCTSCGEEFFSAWIETRLDRAVMRAEVAQQIGNALFGLIGAGQ